MDIYYAIDKWPNVYKKGIEWGKNLIYNNFEQKMALNGRKRHRKNRKCLVLVIRMAKNVTEKKEDMTTMALTKALVREILSTAGVDAEHVPTAVNRIIEGHVSSIEALRDEIAEQKTQIESLRKDTEKAESLSSQLEAANKKIKDLEQYSEKASKYDDLQKEYDDYKAEQIKKEQQQQRTKLLTDMLKDMKIESEEGINLGIKWYSDKVEIGENGKISNGKDLRKEIGEDLKKYVSETVEEGAKTANPPKNTGGGKMTIEQIDAIEDAAERQKAMLENPDLFGL